MIGSMRTNWRGGTGGSAIVASDAAPKCGSATGSGDATSPGCVGGGAYRAHQRHARTGEADGHAAPQLFEPELRRKGRGGSPRRQTRSASAASPDDGRGE